jgi:hypothetical protein
MISQGQLGCCDKTVGDQAVERWYKRQQLARGCARSDREIALEDMKKHLVGIAKKWESVYLAAQELVTKGWYMQRTMWI